MLYFCCKPDNSWARTSVYDYLNNTDAIPEKRGIAYSAAANWHIEECQHICGEVLVSLSNCDDDSVAKAISQVFQFREKVPLTNEMRFITEAVIINDKIVIAAAMNLIEGVKYAVSYEPDLVHRICSRFLDAGTGELKSVASVHGQLAEPIVSIALTLHRMPPPHREQGLKLFERLIESNIQEARYALDMLDRRPIGRSTPMMLPHRRRRKSIEK